MGDAPSSGPLWQQVVALGVVSLVVAAILAPVARALAMAYAKRLLRLGKVKRAMWWRGLAQGRQPRGPRA